MSANAATAGSLLGAAAGSKPAGVVSPLDARQRIRAVLFDLDGTLYDQRRMRTAMAVELLAVPLSRPFAAFGIWRGLSAYRKAQETLRTDGWSGSAEDAQLERAASRCARSPAQLRPIVDEWMLQRPLKHLRRCRATGLVELLTFLAGAGLELGVLSDYPAGAKLRALGVSDFFSTVLCATDPAVGVLKPHPGGFLEACRRWRLTPGEVLVVGDRLDADAAGASAAGMPCVIIGSPRAQRSRRDVLILPSLERLHRVLVHDHRR